MLSTKTALLTLLLGWACIASGYVGAGREVHKQPQHYWHQNAYDRVLRLEGMAGVRNAERVANQGLRAVRAFGHQAMIVQGVDVARGRPSDLGKTVGVVAAKPGGQVTNSYFFPAVGPPDYLVFDWQRRVYVETNPNSGATAMPSRLGRGPAF